MCETKVESLTPSSTKKQLSKATGRMRGRGVLGFAIAVVAAANAFL